MTLHFLLPPPPHPFFFWYTLAGILSASWDPAREGSFLGVDEFKANLPALIDRVKNRSR